MRRTALAPVLPCKDMLRELVEEYTCFRDAVSWGGGEDSASGYLKLAADCAVFESARGRSKEQGEEEKKRQGKMHRGLSRRRRMSRAGIIVGRRRRR